MDTSLLEEIKRTASSTGRTGDRRRNRIEDGGSRIEDRGLKRE
jgi:hypothetical protein